MLSEILTEWVEFSNPSQQHYSGWRQKFCDPSFVAPTSKYNVISIHFCDDGASVLVCTLETHKVCVIHKLFSVTIHLTFVTATIILLTMDVEMVKANSYPM